MGIRENIIKIRKDHQLTQYELAEIAGVSRGAVSQWEGGFSEPRMGAIQKMADALNISKSSIIEDDYSDGYVDAPIYGSIAAGTPIEMIEDTGTFPVPERIAAAHPKGGYLRVRGNSFDRTLPDGCLAYVDFDMREPNEYDAFAVCVNGYAATIKRVRVQPNGVQLVPNSSDPSYQPVTYDYSVPGTDEVTIIGKVVWATMPFDYQI